MLAKVFLGRIKQFACRQAPTGEINLGWVLVEHRLHEPRRCTPKGKKTLKPEAYWFGANIEEGRAPWLSVHKQQQKPTSSSTIGNTRLPIDTDHYRLSSLARQPFSMKNLNKKSDLRSF
ncbi:hypothetical protein NR756_13470 [Alloalcanivorax xenomutans]|uniref:hypothetical protein n=1 Tax=Alloalcanivorax xenomutans TaxID=1094342 RepID=UPI003A806277